MATNLYVGNIPFETTEGEILDLFKATGTVVKCDLILDKYTRKSRGFAFVEMGSQEEADRAVAEIDGKEIGGRQLRVNEARPRGERPGGFEGGARREEWR